IKPSAVPSLVTDTIVRAKQLAGVKIDSCTQESPVTTDCRLARLSYRLEAPQLATTVAKWKPNGI
ncbi:hypothetical protein, partial [Arthrobacter oryzae]|uniref:hypothetical protein n=1 Tax=Arthrobacter oryzae TaxID=409290 RepID=UPI001C838F88